MRLAVKHADAIRRAVQNSVDVNRTVLSWLDTHPVKGVMSVDDIRAWADGHIHTDGAPLHEAITNLYADSWVLGTDIAETAVLAISNKPMLSLYATKTTVSNSNWDHWSPGHKPAALLVKPPGGLASLLSASKIDIKSMNTTTTNRIGTLLSDSLESGQTPDSLAKSIRGLLSDPERALMIAQTEMSRAVSVASRESYDRLGMEKVQWLPADPCAICADNASVGAISIDDEFPSGDTEPPAHPYCRCALAPASSDPENDNSLPVKEPELTDDSGATVNTVAEVPLSTTILDDPPAPIPWEIPIPVVTSKPIKKPAAKKPAQASADYSHVEPADGGSSRKLIMSSQQRQKPGFDQGNVKLKGEREALSAYQGHFYREINAYLRNPKTKGNLSPDIVVKVKTIVKDLDKLMKASPPLEADLLTYRGYSDVNGMATRLRAMKVGDTYEEKGYVSSSLKESVANSGYFAGSGGKVVEIVNLKGDKGIFVDGFKIQTSDDFTEAEWLMPRNTTFKIVANNGNTIRAIAIEHLPIPGEP